MVINGSVISRVGKVCPDSAVLDGTLKKRLSSNFLQVHFSALFSFQVINIL